MPSPASRTARRRALEPAFELARSQVADGVVPFVILGVADREGLLRLESFQGDRGPRIGTDAVCLLASVTKPIVATAVIQQVEAGRIDLATPLGEWAPDVLGPRWAPITAWHILTHTSGLHDIDLEAILRHGAGRADLLHHVAKQVQVTSPGTSFHYATFTFDLLAEALGRVLAEPFESVMARSLLEPLGMTDTGFDPAAEARLAGRMAPVSIGGWERPPSVEDATLVGAYAALRLMGGGLWSTAPDLLRFARALLRDGELDGVRVLSPALVDLMTREVTAPREVTWGGLGSASDPLEASHYALGWGKPGVQTASSSRAFGHGGVSGTRLWIDPGHDLAYVYLSGRWGLPTAPIDAVEHRIHAALSA